MEPVSLAVVLSLVAAGLGMEEEPQLPSGEAGELGLSDAELFSAIWSRDFSLVINDEVPFARAVSRDPRRIDAIVQGHLLDPIVRPLATLQQQDNLSETIAKQVYLLRNAALRETHGLITPLALAQASGAEWASYRAVLSRLLVRMAKAQDAVAKAVAQALVNNHAAIDEAFNNAQKTLEDAENIAVGQADKDAWRSMQQTLGETHTTVAATLEELRGETMGAICRSLDEDLERMGALSLDSGPQAAAISTGTEPMPPGSMP